MQRFFFDHITLGPTLTISEETFVHQISRVLRYTTSDQIVLFNGDGKDSVYEITAITKKDVSLNRISFSENTADPVKHIYLYQALPNKYEKIEYIIQKGVEVGIGEFIFFPSERSQKLVINERKIARFMDIAREALEQCGGNRMPSIRFETKKIFPLKMKENIFVLHTTDNKSKNLTEISKMDLGDFSLFVGPEGGWSDAEITQF
ncbi:MAG: RsmE family RNA methyltransferase, partial [Candidatus Gracilibacteria bacterium]|nr:RsmE family RNA methyltransferase [Candidatus Gracilibacteria bacterium]